MHRLNRAEYDNTVRDLLGTQLRLARDTFPADDFAFGFDNNADALQLTLLHLEMYEVAAEMLIDELFARGNVPERSQRIEAEAADATTGSLYDSGVWGLYGEGDLTGSVFLDADGDYSLTVRAFQHQAGDDDARLAVLVDGVEVAELAIDAPETEPAQFGVDVPLTAGRHHVGVRYINDFKVGTEADRNVLVDWFEVTGPLNQPRPASPSYDLVVTCDPEAIGEAPCAEQVVTGFMGRAWRRPPTLSERNNKMEMYAASRNDGGDWVEGVATALQSVLVSPNFVFRAEIDPDPNSDTAQALSPHELASRLSYFIWSSTPDTELLDRARDGTLVGDNVLQTQIRRMLADPKAAALVDNFAGQWLYLRRLDEVVPDTTTFPEFDDALRASMQEEARLFVSDILLRDASMLELLTADWTYVDARLADFYGLPQPEGPGHQRVSTAGSNRQGFMTQGSWTTATSHPDRTSPVIRGKWVLGNMMCQSVPDPPIDVMGVVENDPNDGLTIREEMAQHLTDPSCASCHEGMDNIGLALEHFDAVGNYRLNYSDEVPVDATGAFASLGSFDGAIELSNALASDPSVPKCVVQKTLIYALGRNWEYDDGDLATLAEAEDRFAASGYRFTELVEAIAMSGPFRYRRAL